MEASTTIHAMLADKEFFVPNYQRAYSWDTECENSAPPKQVNTFLADLEDYNRSQTKSPYYFGHFLFEQKNGSKFAVIDGQQRLTTIIIFLSALFNRLKTVKAFTEQDQKIHYRFSTVDYDKSLFKGYVLEQTEKGRRSLKTESAKRFADAFDFFSKKLAKKDEAYLRAMLKTIQTAQCTTHTVHDEAEAVQMFIFQNDRGKTPSNLERVKAQFMFHVHLHAQEHEKADIFEDIKCKFDRIYQSIALIERRINEDDILLYALRVHFNSLREDKALERVHKRLSEADSILFIKEFTHLLAKSFEWLTEFYDKDEKNYFPIYSLITLGGIAIAMPFILKTYQFNLPTEKLSRLCTAFESLLLRSRVIGTRADIISRLNDIYQKFTAENADIQPILAHIADLETKDPDEWWWAYWNNEKFEAALFSGNMSHSTAKFLLWKYENYLNAHGKSGYAPIRFEAIIAPELEHISPSTENPAAGYADYDERFYNEYLHCLGNFLLLPKSHNCSIGNKPFAEKRGTYEYLAQQREVRDMTEDKQVWKKREIDRRQKKIVAAIMSIYQSGSAAP